jgi:ATP-binding cassette subfamily B protein/ATP-binding cassette subfamily C protein
MTVETAAQMRLVRAQTGTRLAAGALTGVAVGAVYLVLLVLLVAGGIPLGAAATALLALQSARINLNKAIHAANGLYEDALYYNDFRDFLDRAAQHVPPSGGQPVDGVEQIRLDNVCLYYTGAGTPAVDGVSLSLRRGEVIALVGENGCGKSSLAKLIAGLYEPNSGTICWDGRDVSHLDRPSMSAHVTVISQNWWRFPFTARENIVVGRSDRPAGEGLSMRDAAQAATAHDMIAALPYGYDTLLDPEFRHGHDLSGGQWQRLVSARGFYRDTTVLICDEPSSALDPHAEDAIFQQLRARPDRTIVLITHRLANVRHADRIYVMNHGRIVQEGTHDELVVECGPYQEMFRLQASGYA